MLAEDLRQFTGTEQYHKHWLNFVYTDGVAYLAEKAKCYWLLDAIGSYQPELRKKKEIPFQLWILKVKNSKAVLTMSEDKGAKVLVKQEIDYTDFPMESIELYYIDNVLLLPSEY